MEGKRPGPAQSLTTSGPKHQNGKNIAYKAKQNKLKACYVPHLRWVRTSFTHDVSWPSEWNFTKLALIYQWDKLKGWLYFDDLAPIFKVTGGLKYVTFSLYSQYVLNYGVEFHQFPKTFTGLQVYIPRGYLVLVILTPIKIKSQFYKC